MERKLFNTISGDTEEEKNADDVLRVFEEDNIAVAENEKQNKFKIKQFFNDLAEEMKPEISKRIENFELDESIADEIERDIKKSYSLFNDELLSLSENNFWREIEEYIDENENNFENKNVLHDLVKKFTSAIMSSAYFVEMINRKLNNNLTSDEQDFLRLISHFKEKNSEASYNAKDENIKLSLFNNMKEKDYKSSIMHEFTHKALDKLCKEKIKLINSLRHIQKFNEFNTEEDIEKENNNKLKLRKNKKEINMYLKFEIIINESLAFIAQSYYGEIENPPFKLYGRKTDPILFEKVYDDIKDASINKSIEEFDKFSAELYMTLVKDFHEDINEEQLASIFRNTREKVDSFKNN